MFVILSVPRAERFGLYRNVFPYFHSMNIPLAIEHLSRVDPDLRKLIDHIGEITVPQPKSDFETLIDSIVSQQLSVKAAATIFERVLRTLDFTVLPQQILNTSVEDLRAAGLSGQKTKYLYALSEAFIKDPSLNTRLHTLTDEEVIKTLTEIKGIGVWTAQMFMMFTLLREDVFPVGDLGIRKGMERLLFEGEAQSHEDLIARAEVWSPYRSVASLYIWKGYKK